MKPSGRLRATRAAETGDYAPLTGLFDPECDHTTFREYIDRYVDRISSVRVLIGRNERETDDITHLAVLSARQYHIPVVARVESSMVVVPRGMLPFYLDLCAEQGITRIQFRRGSLQSNVKPRDAVTLADDRNLEVLFEIEDTSAYSGNTNPASTPAINEALGWLDAGAIALVADPRQNFNSGPGESHDGHIDGRYAEFLAQTVGIHTIMFKAPRERVQDSLLALLGTDAHLCDVPLAHIQRIESRRMSASWSRQTPTAEWESEERSHKLAG